METHPLIKRIKSFAWRASMVAVVAALAWASENIGLLDLPPQLTVILGLILGEVTKWLNSSAK